MLKSNSRNTSSYGVEKVVDMSVERDGIQTPTDARQTDVGKV